MVVPNSFWDSLRGLPSVTETRRLRDCPHSFQFPLSFPCMLADLARELRVYYSAVAAHITRCHEGQPLLSVCVEPPSCLAARPCLTGAVNHLYGASAPSSEPHAKISISAPTVVNSTMVALPLNGTRIAFLHPDDTGLAAPCAVQIDMKSKTYVLFSSSFDSAHSFADIRVMMM